MRVDIITLFPELIQAFLGVGVTQAWVSADAVWSIDE